MSHVGLVSFFRPKVRAAPFIKRKQFLPIPRGYARKAETKNTGNSQSLYNELQVFLIPTSPSGGGGASPSPRI